MIATAETPETPETHETTVVNVLHLAVVGAALHHLDVETILLARMIEIAVIETETVIGTMTTVVALAVQSTVIVTGTAIRKMIVIAETMTGRTPMAKIEKVRLPAISSISWLIWSVSC